ncbi:glutathione S-transferase C-terminal domain-containing protein, partial [Burkholderia pseudomallei]|uniref:glutathione S-transferase C-terminal domain-containing protein n=1 Tax=Burkholderia pseudomallei TaxID=28450 RepID=UPI001F2A0087
GRPVVGSAAFERSRQFLAKMKNPQWPCSAAAGRRTKANNGKSHTIVRYLADAYGGGRFRPSDPLARSLEDRWMDWMLATLQPDFLTGVFWAYYRTPEHERQWDGIRRKVSSCADHVRLLDRQLADREFLCGDRLSVADIAVGVTCYRYYELDIERPHAPNVERWYGALQQRPPYQRNVMLPFSNMKGRLNY